MAPRPGPAALSARRPARASAGSAVALAVILMACGVPDSSPPSPEPPPTVRPRGYSAPVVLGVIQDPAIDEASGLAASRTSPGLLWVHNDSGDAPFVYCLTRNGGRCGTWSVTGARARDWEDMAVGPGPRPGTSYLYVGDIGDNRSDQPAVTVYRMPEPTPGTGAVPTGPQATEAAIALRLRYADGPHDAEALLVHPTTADVYVVTKDAPARVYRAGPDGVLALVATVRMPEGEWVTGGDVSPDGRRVLLSSYLGGLEMELPATSRAFDDVWSQPPLEVDLGRLVQTEAAAYRLDGDAVVATSERSPAPLHEAVRAGPS